VVATSYLQNSGSRELFINRRYAILKQLLNLSLAVLLFLLDKNGLFHRVHQDLKSFSLTVQHLISYPEKWLLEVNEYTQTQHDLLVTNEALRQELLIMQSKMHQLQAFQKRYQELNTWVNSNEPMTRLAGTANMLSIDVNPNRHIYILDRGKNHHVFEGQVALDGLGLIGQVIDVGSHTSSLLMISDAKCAVPVVNQRSGEHGIVVGQNDIAALQLVNVAKTSDVSIGDTLTTSGLGLVYPFGIPVGKIVAIENVPGEEFLKIIVKPFASLNKHHMVMLLESLKDINLWRQQLEERMKALEEVNA
jgi:rod shape-determining protein MreC